MEAARARQYLKALKDWLKTPNDDGETVDEGYIESLDMALEAIEPPVGAGHCDWIYLPDKDMTPYSHMPIVTELEDLIDTMRRDRHKQKVPHEDITHLLLNHDKLIVVDRALMIYKSVLMRVNRDEVKAEIEKAIEERKNGNG